MTIQDWGAIGNIVAAIGVIASLLHLAIQIRQNNAYIRHQAMFDTLAAVRETEGSIYSDPELSRIFSDRSNYARLPAVERQRFDMAVHALLTVFANYRDFGQDGMIKPEMVEHIPDVVSLWVNEGWFLEHWSTYSMNFFDREFVSYVDGVLREQGRHGSPH